MKKSIKVILVITLIIVSLAFGFFKYLYPKLQMNNEISIGNCSINLDWYENNAGMPIKLSIYEAHNNSYFVFDPAKSKVLYVDGSGNILWEKKGGLIYYQTRNYFFNTDKGTFVQTGYGTLEHYDKNGELVSSIYIMGSAYLPNLGYHKNNETAVKGEDDFYYFYIDGLGVYNFINKKGETLFEYSVTDLYEIKKLNNDYYYFTSITSENDFFILNNKGGLIWRRSKPATIITEDFNGGILFLKDNVLEYISYDGKTTYSLNDIDECVAGNYNGEDYFYAVMTDNSNVSIVQYDNTFKKISTIGSYGSVDSLAVHAGFMMFKGDHFIYKYNNEGEEIAKYSDDGYEISYFDDNFTVLSNSESEVFCINDEGEMVFTLGKITQVFYFKSDDDMIITYEKNGHFLKKVDREGRQIFIKGGYQDLTPGNIYISKKGEIAYSYMQNDVFYAVLDKDGNDIINGRLIGYDIHKGFNYNVYVESGSSKKRIHFKTPI